MRLALIVSCLLLAGCSYGPEIRDTTSATRHEIRVTLVRHPTVESVQRAGQAYRLPANVCGFYVPLLREIHVPHVRGWHDLERMAVIGHEILHVTDGDWHAGSSLARVWCE